MILSSYDEKFAFVREWTENELKDVSEYGYGFWAKYSSTFPTELPTGLKGDYFMLSRMTINSDIDKSM